MEIRVLIVGGQKVWAIENYYQRYLSEEGAEVKIFPIHDLFFQKITDSIFYRIFNRLGFSPIYNSVNEQLKQKINTFRPNIVWVFKGMEVQPKTLNWIKSKNIKLVNYNPDNPFLFTGKGSGNSNITNSIGLYDLHFTYSYTIQKELREKFQTKTAYLPFGVDISPTIFEKSQRENKEETLKACFLGNPDKHRADFLNKLAQAGILIDVYGHNWDKFVSHPNFTLFNPVYGETFWEVLQRYRIQLNLMRIHNEDAHNMRSFEIPGIGGIQLAPKTNEHQAFFTEGVDIFMYADVEECIKKFNDILHLSKEAALQIREQAKWNIQSKKHTYKDRAKQVFEILASVL